MELDADALAAFATDNGFTGAIRVENGAECLFEQAFGMADRAHGIPNTPQTQFGMASGSKTFTALAVLSLVADGTMALDDPVRRWLGADLPQIDDAVTVRHLLGHNSGVGEYLDDDADADEYLLPGSMHTYTSPEDFLPVLDVPMLAAPGSPFEYSNAGFVVLGLVAQRPARRPSATSIRTPRAPTSSTCRSRAARTAAPTPPSATPDGSGSPSPRVRSSPPSWSSS